MTRTLCALALLCLWIAFPSSALDWPNYRGPNYDGISEETIPANLPAELPVKWRAQVGIGFCTVSVVGDRVLTMGNRTVEGVETDTVWCLSAETGELLWQHSYPCALDPRYYEGGPGATPTVEGEAVYTLSKKGHALRLELATGRVAWGRDLVADHAVELPEWSFAGSPFVDGDRLLLNVGRGGIALDKETGETIWLSSTETSGYATVVPYEAGAPEASRLLFSAKGLVAFDPATGKAASDLPWRTSRDVNAADPIVIGKRILVSSASGAALIEPRSGGGEPELVWEQKDMRWYFNPGVLLDGHLYSLHGTTHRPTELMCVEAETGRIVWREPGFGSGGLMAAGGTVVLFDLGVLTLFDADPSGYRPRLRQKLLEGTCWTAPVLANGRIYCRNALGELVCVGVGE
jgi:outer membrane protein assembly factor BamB